MGGTGATLSVVTYAVVYCHFFTAPVIRRDGHSRPVSPWSTFHITVAASDRSMCLARSEVAGGNPAHSAGALHLKYTST